MLILHSSPKVENSVHFTHFPYSSTGTSFAGMNRNGDVDNVGSSILTSSGRHFSESSGGSGVWTGMFRE